MAIVPGCQTHPTPSSSAWALDATTAVVTAGTLATEVADASIPDARLEAALDAAVARDPVLDGLPIHVSVDNGHVVLFGTVPSLAIKWRQARLVGAFKGVTSLTDGTVVAHSLRPDAALATDVSGAIAGDAATRGSHVQASARAGAVTLTGQVRSYAQRELLAELTSRVDGVEDVELALAIVPSSHRADAEIEGDVTDDLLEDGRLDGPRITARVHGGAATVTGFVGSLAQRDAVVNDALRGGATSVDATGLRIDWIQSVRQRARARQPVPGDGTIAAAVTRALSEDPRMGLPLPAVRVERGVVTLSGPIVDFRASRAAARDARFVTGVSRVDNRLAVASVTHQSDLTIQRQVLGGISTDVAAADSQDVQVTTRQARVTLRGTVASRRDRTVIEEDVEEVPGVIAVENDLQVRGNDLVIAPETIRKGVVEALFWDPRIASHDIAVDVSGEGNVTLTGRAESWQEVRAAGDDAVRAGAANVDNRVQSPDEAPDPLTARP